MIGKIELTHDEEALAREIVFDHDGSVRLDNERTIANGEKAANLVENLLDREAIPEYRLRYFVDPEYNIGNTKASLREMFLRNSGSDGEMYRHPHFLKYLRYFVFGADLPRNTKEAFAAKFDESDGDRRELVQFARGQFRALTARTLPQGHLLPEAFYQLALDSGCEQWDARAVRDAVKKIR
jgi:hypothetical protein